MHFICQNCKAVNDCVTERTDKFEPIELSDAEWKNYELCCLYTALGPLLTVDHILKVLLGEEFFQIAVQDGKLKESWIDTVRLATAMIFEQRYGWEPERTKDMSLNQIHLALEHAIEYDHPNKPSIWKIT